MSIRRLHDLDKSGWWLLISLMLFARRRELQRVEGLRPAILALGALVLAAGAIERPIAPGEVHEYLLDLERGDYFELHVDQLV